nr:4Fe-4S dicluster domain-containing protein [Desulfuromonadales bacterium]
MKRRDFVKNSLVFVSGAGISLSALQLVDPREVLAANPAVRWAFLVDTHKCVGCGFCVKACKVENEIPLAANVTRTWVERYVIKKDGEVRMDSPKGALNGFTSKKLDQNASGMLEIPDEEITQEFFVPKLCNQCENPPCVQVCPVGATYQTKDHVVLVDRKWCIGCGYCIMGCPYGVRFFHPDA